MLMASFCSDDRTGRHVPMRILLFSTGDLRGAVATLPRSLNVSSGTA